jgi:hypothetical protein
MYVIIVILYLWGHAEVGQNGVSAQCARERGWRERYLHSSQGSNVGFDLSENQTFEPVFDFAEKL